MKPKLRVMQTKSTDRPGRAHARDDQGARPPRPGLARSSVSNTPSFRGAIKKVLHLVTRRRSGSASHELTRLSKLAKPAGATHDEDASRARRRLRPRQDGRSRPEGPVRARRAASSRTSRAGRRRIQRRLPKRGFNNPFPTQTAEVNVGDLDGLRARARTSTRRRSARAASSRAASTASRSSATASSPRRVTVTAHAFSKSAAEKIEKAGGKVVLVGGRAEPARRRRLAERLQP